VARFVRGTDGLFKSGSGSKAEPCARECQTFVNEIAVGTVIADRPLFDVAADHQSRHQGHARTASARLQSGHHGYVPQAVTAQKREAQSGVVRLFRVSAMAVKECRVLQIVRAQ
jgi:hypothetical protein